MVISHNKSRNAQGDAGTKNCKSSERVRSANKRFTVTIKDQTIWTTNVKATDRNAAEDKAWHLFDKIDRNRRFCQDDDTTITVEEFVS